MHSVPLNQSFIRYIYYNFYFENTNTTKMKIQLFIPYLLFTPFLNAQTFTRTLPKVPLEAVEMSATAFADVDGDNDMDVLISGRNNANVLITSLYLNDGLGNFEEVSGTPFEGIKDGAIAFADIDGDNDQDVLISGATQNNNGTSITKLYTNDGTGVFTEVSGTPFDETHGSAIAFADIDGDHDLDVLLSGNSKNIAGITKLFKNDGSGNFMEVAGTPFLSVYYGSIAFGDIDGDTDLDVLITGESFFPRINVTKLYKNDGTGNFTEVPGTPFDPVSSSSIAFTDVDGDNDLDVLISGDNDTTNIVKLYANNGTGQFTEVAGTPFEGVKTSSIAVADIDGSNGPDLIITGYSNDLIAITKLYKNNGAGVFSEVTDTPFPSIHSGSVGFADIDGDHDQDVLITGYQDSFTPIAKLFSNDGIGNFTELKDSPFEGMAYGSVAFADVDGDNDQDFLVSGRNTQHRLNTKLYLNDGSGSFAEDLTVPFEGVDDGAVAFADVDGDLDQDLLITGSVTFATKIAKLYINDGAGTFTEMQGTPFEGVWSSSVAFADIDGDNDPDVLIAGRNNSTSGTTKLYTNDGTGNFAEVVGTPFDSVNRCDIAFADIDGDNDQDVLITGRNTSEVQISKLYTNDGTGVFTEVINTPFDGVEYGSVDFADIDGDYDQDVLITGVFRVNNVFILGAKLFSNDGTGNYTEIVGTPFHAVFNSSVSFIDVDGDKDPDVLIAGSQHSSDITQLYINDGSGNFTEASGNSFIGLNFVSTAFADIDGDSDPDFVIIGKNTNGTCKTIMYFNQGSPNSINDYILASQSNISLYPNPNNGEEELNIDYYSKKPIDLNISLLDINGQKLLLQKEAAIPGLNRLSIKTPDLPKGAYILKVDDGIHISYLKLLIQ